MRILEKIFFILLTLILWSFLGLAHSIPEKDIDGVTQAVYEVYHANLDEVGIIPIKGGLSGDRLYKVTKGEKVSVVRVHEISKNVDRKKQEYLCAQIAFDLDLGPEVLYVSKTFDVMATAFAKGKHPNVATFDDPRMIEILATSLKKLHDGPAFILPWNVFHDVRSRASKAIDSEMKLALVRLDKIEEAMKKASFPSKPCHNDIHSGNLFVDGKKFSFIDWEDAGMGDPYYDLARASLLFAFDSKQDEVFLSSYMEDITELARSRLFLMKQVFILRMAFWTASQGGELDKSSLQSVFNIFKTQNYVLPINGEKEIVRWKDTSKPFLTLFLRNTNSAVFEKSLKEVQREVRLQPSY